MSEDCLRLNIYVPVNDLEELLPVLVFIHGGAFHYISGNPDLIYGPQLLMRKDVICVTINYRLGALGFMSLGIEEASGNAGIKDIILALRWIKTNIHKFGGSTNDITIGGNSSGASIVNYLLMTSHSSDLFHRAILLSGSALSYRALSKHPVENTLTLAKQLCSQNENKNLILKCLREADVFDIVKAQLQMKREDNNILRPFTPFLPSIEKEFPHAVLTKDPRQILGSHSTKLQNVPVLAGFNTHEGMVMAIESIRRPNNINILRKDIEMIIPSNIEYPLGSEKSMAVARSIAKFYFGDESFSNWTLDNALDLISDTHYIFGIDTWINLYKERNDKNSVYYYIFNFDGDLNWGKIFYNITNHGASHSDEMGYLFLTNVTKSKLVNSDTRSRRTVDVFTTLITNFVKHGNPTPESFSNIIWPEYGAEKEVLLLNDNPTVIKMLDGFKRRLKFWHDIYNDYYLYVENGGQLENKELP